MPKVVDHDVRRRELADAVWRVVRAEGIDRVSVRSVAAEAGTSPGALRHYFATQEELAAFALRMVIETAGARILALLESGDGLATAVAVLEELLPIDAQRRAELEVYLAFIGIRAGQESLRAIQAEADAQSRLAVASAVALLGHDEPPEDLVDDVYAFVDGLALHGTLWPERYPPARLRSLLAGRLESMATG